MVKVVLGALLSVPETMVLVAEKVAEARTGKFCSRLGPVCGPPGVFIVTPSWPRSIPSAEFAKMALPRMASSLFGAGRRGADAHARPGVEGDGIARAGGGSADRVARAAAAGCGRRLPPLPRALIPVASVPIKLPSIRLPVAGQRCWVRSERRRRNCPRSRSPPRSSCRRPCCPARR